MRGAQIVCNGAECSSTKSIINFSLITSFLAYIKWNGFLTLPLQKSWNPVPLHVMKYPFIKCLCVTMELLLVSTKIVARSTDIELNCAYYVPRTKPGTGSPSDTITNFENRVT